MTLIGSNLVPPRKVTEVFNIAAITVLNRVFNKAAITVLNRADFNGNGWTP